MDQIGGATNYSPRTARLFMFCRNCQRAPRRFPYSTATWRIFAVSDNPIDSCPRCTDHGDGRSQSASPASPELEAMSMTRLLPIVAFVLSGMACAPIKSEVRETVVWRGPLETYRGPPAAQWTPVVHAVPTDPSLDIRVVQVQLCRQDHRQSQRIRRETVRTGGDWITSEVVLGLGLSAVPVVLWATDDSFSFPTKRVPFEAFWMLPLLYGGPALLIAGGADSLRARDSVEEFLAVKSHADILHCASKPASLVAITVLFSDGSRVDTQLDQSGTVSVPIPPALLEPEARSASAAVLVGGGRPIHLPIPPRHP